MLGRRAWPTRTAARKAIFEYIEGWYNTRQRHSTSDYLSPVAYEAALYTKPALAQVA
jgi:transposase InsO family protein